ncbi:hypothetical protein JTB14_008809 [Gonioctena quinquepunctata]|nr:hypothetical protein JTB14_008809 [Gonioctena quinquepunctata]
MKLGGKMFPYLINERENKKLARNHSPRKSSRDRDREGDHNNIKPTTVSYSPRYQNPLSSVPSPPVSPNTRKRIKIQKGVIRL